MLSWAMLVAEPSQTEGSCLAGLWQCRQLAALGPGPLPSSSILPPENACGGPRARPSRPVPGQVEMCLFFSQFGCHAWSETTSESVCVWVRETTEREREHLAVASSSRSPISYWPGGQPCMHLHTGRHSGEERAHAGHGQQQLAAFSPSKRRACEMSSKSCRKGNSLDHLVPPHPCTCCVPVSRCSSSQKSLRPLCL
jgi:hypothetical protein